MPKGEIYKTGEKSPANAYYKWIGYTDGTTSPYPTEEEMKIHLEAGDVFPPIRSCNKGAFWQMTSYA